jgi:hypothetical protein
MGGVAKGKEYYIQYIEAPAANLYVVLKREYWPKLPKLAGKSAV